MLRGIQKASSTWLGKAVLAVIMGFLIISFAVWGIGDIFRGVGRNTVAEIGNAEISIEQFRQYYSERLQTFGRQMGRPLTPDQARAIGLDRQILGQLVAETALDEQARNLRLGLTDAEIAQRITGDPAFRGPNGQFDHSRFVEMIRQAGYTEPRFVAEQRNVMLRRQIAQSVSGDLRVPNAMMAAVNQFQNERRDIEYLALGPAQAGDVPQPTPEQLSAYFEERKALFRAPEYRKLTLLPLAPAELAKPAEIPDADAKAYYEPRKDSYGKPEKRELRQIVFPNEADAAAARDRIAKGATFDDIAKERDLKASDSDVGMVAKAEIIDPAVAEAAFALKPEDVSQPVKGRFGSVLVKVGKIEPGETKTYEDVAANIKRELAEARARSEINSLRDKVEDERAAGSTLAEAAKKLNLNAVTVEAVDRAGRAPDGKPAAGLPQGVNVLNAAFASDVGSDSEALQMPGNGFLYYDVVGVTPSRERSLDEVKDQVATRWRDDEIAKRLTAKADELLGKLKAGTPLAQVATEAGLKLETAVGLQRGQATPATPGKLIEAVFKTAKDGAGVAEGASDTQRFVFRVTQVTAPTFDASSPQGQQLASTLQSSYADNVIGEYVARLETDLGVKINQSALNQVIGGGAQ
ncbi:MAG: SurA N-terminal domain-containing protein [Pseudolabrys sp.]